jgi:hypothetical protein
MGWHVRAALASGTFCHMAGLMLNSKVWEVWVVGQLGAPMRKAIIATVLMLTVAVAVMGAWFSWHWTHETSFSFRHQDSSAITPAGLQPQSN